MIPKSPKQVAFAIAFLASLLGGVLSVIISHLNDYILSTSAVFAFILIMFSSTFFVCLFLIEKFIYSKIKIIYKTINNLKTNQSIESLDMNEDILKQLNRNVLRWDRDRKKEIDELKSRETFRREFLGNVAHELKTPIHSIQGYILTLLEGAIDDPNVNKKFLERAQFGVERMTKLLDDLDKINDIENGNYIFEFKPDNIIALTSKVIEVIEQKAQKRNISIELKNETKNGIVFIDHDRITQVMTNLLANSINYGNDKGTTKISFYELGDKVLVEIKDNGIGIDEEHINHIFERFFRVDKSRSRFSGGTGLGLSICKKIIEAHGETISVRSKVSEGTTFSFTLPKKEKSLA